MSVPVSTAVRVAEEIFLHEEFRLRTGIEVTRCGCGASAMRLTDAGPVCAGCGEARPLPDPGREPTRGEGVQDQSPAPARVLDAVNLNQAPLRVIDHREVMAGRTRLYLECGHALERAYTGWAHRARCGDCLREGRVR